MYLLWTCTNPRRINGAGIYSREASIQGNTVHMYNFLCSDSAIYFFIFLSTLHGVYTRDCSYTSRVPSDDSEKQRVAGTLLATYIRTYLFISFNTNNIQGDEGW